MAGPATIVGMDEHDQHRPRRPALLGKAAIESLGGAPDPAELAEAAHATAQTLVDAGRAVSDPVTIARLVRLVDDHGLDTIAGLWSERPARSLPGALWRLYALREWVRCDPREASADFSAGQPVVPVSSVIAGAADPPTPEALRELTDAILSGVFVGWVYFHYPFFRVVAAGRAHRADDVEPYDDSLAALLTRRSASLLQTGEDLEAAASLWRSHDLV